MTNKERRAALRFDKVFPVQVDSLLYGTIRCVARNISEGGMFLETPEPFPLGTEVHIHFEQDGEAMVARGEVKNHYFFNYAQGSRAQSLSGMGIRFLHFEAGEALGRLLH
jgi:PilZ domain-containing protein